MTTNTTTSTFRIFSEPKWWLKAFNEADEAFIGITRDRYDEARRKAFGRRCASRSSARRQDIRELHAGRVRCLEVFSRLPYVTPFASEPYQRPMMDGRGWQAVNPYEREDNILVTDPIVVAMLRKRYDKFFATHARI